MQNRSRSLLIVFLLAAALALPLQAAEPASDGFFAQLVQQIVGWALDSEVPATEGPELPCPPCRIEKDVPNPVSEPPCSTCHIEKDTP